MPMSCCHYSFWLLHIPKIKEGEKEKEEKEFESKKNCESRKQGME